MSQDKILKIGTRVIMKKGLAYNFHGLSGEECEITAHVDIGTGKHQGYEVDNHNDGICDISDFEKILKQST